jgi:hypothetical protein
MGDGLARGHSQGIAVDRTGEKRWKQVDRPFRGVEALQKAADTGAFDPLMVWQRAK